MRLEQYAYFSLSSETVSAEEISVHLNMRADDVSVLGSKDPERPTPVAHRWKIECRDPNLHLDRQMLEVLDRVAPVGRAIGHLVDEGEVWACLQGVRTFDSRGRSDPHLDPLVGLSLPLEALILLTSMGAYIDIDEYAMSRQRRTRRWLPARRSRQS